MAITRTIALTRTMPADIIFFLPKNLLHCSALVCNSALLSWYCFHCVLTFSACFSYRARISLPLLSTFETAPFKEFSVCFLTTSACLSLHSSRLVLSEFLVNLSDSVRDLTSFCIKVNNSLFCFSSSALEVSNSLFCLRIL